MTPTNSSSQTTHHNLPPSLNNSPDDGIYWVLLNQLNHVIPAKWKLKSSKFHIVLRCVNIEMCFGYSYINRALSNRDANTHQHVTEDTQVANSTCFAVGSARGGAKPV